METNIAEQKKVNLKITTKCEFLKFANRVNDPMIIEEHRNDLSQYLGCRTDMTNTQGLST